MSRDCGHRGQQGGRGKGTQAGFRRFVEDSDSDALTRALLKQSQKGSFPFFMNVFLTAKSFSKIQNSKVEQLRKILLTSSMFPFLSSGLIFLKHASDYVSTYLKSSDGSF